MSHQWKEISTFIIDKFGHNMYLGNFKGEIIRINRKKVNNLYVLIDKTIKVHKLYVMSIKKL